MKTPQWILALAAIVCVIQAPHARAEQPPRPSAHPRPSGELGSAAWVSTAVLAVGLCVIVGMAAMSRRFTSPAGARQPRIVGRVALSPRHSVHLLQVGRRVLLLGTGPQGTPTLLAELDPIDDPPISPSREIPA